MRTRRRTIFSLLLPLLLTSSGLHAQSRGGAQAMASMAGQGGLVSSAIPTYQIHLTGSLPIRGSMSVNPGERVDQLLFEHLMFDYGIGTVKEIVFQQSEFDLRNIKIIRKNGAGAPDTLVADLFAYNFGSQLEWNPELKDGDIVQVLRRSAEDPLVSISGSVPNPLVVPYRSGDTALDLILLSGGKTPDALKNRVDVLRTTGGASPAKRFQLTDEEAKTFALIKGDLVIVPRDSEIRALRHVKVEGEVLTPGIYPVDETTTSLYDVIEMAGGTTPYAKRNGVRVIRPSENPFPVIDPRKEMGLEEILTLFLPSSLPQNQTMMMMNDNTQQNKWVPEMMRLSDQYLEVYDLLKGEILLNQTVVHADLDDDESTARIILYDGDVVRVERLENTIQMMGQVSVNGFFAFDSSYDVDDYIQLAGGFGPAADSNRVFIIKSGPKSWKRPSETTLEPGDIVFVDRTPMMAYREDRAAKLTEFSIELQEKNIRRQTVFTAISSALSVITTYLLIRDRSN